MRTTTDIDPHLQETVRAAVRVMGVRKVAALLTLTGESVSRIAGGLPVLRGTLMIARQNVARLEHVGGTVGGGGTR